MSAVWQYLAQYAPLARTALLLVVAVASAAGGAWISGLVKDVEIKQIRKDASDRAATAERTARELLQAAISRGNDLTDQLYAANRAALLNHERLDEALSRVTTGRRCLGADALRLLDGADTTPTKRLPPAASGTAAADGTAATDQPIDAPEEGPWASDTDVAHWASLARTRYDECRRRIDAVRAFYLPSSVGALQ